MAFDPTLPTVWGDTETFSECNLLVRGADVYARDPSTEVLLFPFAIDPPRETAEVVGARWWSPEYGEPVQLWDRAMGEPCPYDLEHALEHPDQYNWVFQNLPFDRGILRHVLGVDLPLANCYDTAAQARSVAMPANLGQMGTALGVADDQAKNKDGKKLINRFSKPAPRNHKATRYTHLTHPEEWERFRVYAVDDVKAMRLFAKLMPRRNYLDNAFERQLWEITTVINERGIPIDERGIRSVIQEVDAYRETTLEEMQRISGLDNPNSPAQLSKWLAEQGIEMPNMQAGTLQDVLEKTPELPGPVREMLLRRLSIGRTPTKKLDSLLNIAVDGRVHDALLWCGASRTGRYSSRGINLQNIPRGSYPAEEVKVMYQLAYGDVLGVFYDDIFDVATSMIRGAIKAPDGMKLVVSDLSAIESRVLAWLTGEEWKLQAFRDIDNPDITAADIYCRVYGQAFAIDPLKVNKKQRQQGKVVELACGFEGGVGGFQTFAAMYRIDLDALWGPVAASAPDWAIQKSERSWEWAENFGRTQGLSENAYRACHILVHLWRDAHPKTVSLWGALESACKQAILNPGTVYMPGEHLRVCVVGEFLLIKLPSGRYLHYYKPELQSKQEPKFTIETYELDGHKVTQPVQNGTRTRQVIRFWGVDSVTRQWTRQCTYSGKLAENVTQAAARDIIVSSLPQAEAEGYESVLLVHDENVTLVPDSPAFTHERLSEILSVVPGWAPGLPLAAAGFEDYRYKKD